MSAQQLHKAIIGSRELRAYELRGLLRGEERGKTMDVPLATVLHSLEKQGKDLAETILNFYAKQADAADLKKCLADIRNVAGLCFLKVQEEEEGVKPL